MSSQASENRRLEVELPTDAFAHYPWDPERLAAELRELWLLELVRQRRFGFAKAAELAEVPLPIFLERMREHRITAFDLDPDELDQELS